MIRALFLLTLTIAALVLSICLMPASITDASGWERTAAAGALITAAISGAALVFGLLPEPLPRDTTEEVQS